MNRKHGNYINGKRQRWCGDCKKPIGSQGWYKHEEIHNKEVDLNVEIRSPEKTSNFVTTLPQVSEPVSPYSKVSKEDIEIAFKWFPRSPLAFNAVTFLAAAADDEDVIEKLKTAFIYLDLEIQARGGWED